MIIVYGLLFVLLLSLSVLIYHKNYRNLRRTIVFKSLSSLLFLSMAIYAYIFIGSYHIFEIFIITALFFSLIGDVLICFIRKKIYFISAGISFFIAHIVYVIGFCYITGISLIELLIIGVLWLLFPLAVKISKVSIKSHYLVVYGYYAILVIMAVKALSFIFYQPFGLVNALLISIGGFLFLVSDVIIFFEKFDRNLRIKLFIPNLLTYYIGQALIALSLSMII